ncbi:hypothetical protein [Chloroflexus sp.]|uniref:hypothetical protein n=1 Tax=Chloroflexus sp. TaxID=1904827 RepID=UPI00260B83EB|nr:hypothetical protein [uncultured Chloroflexus sp.]
MVERGLTTILRRAVIGLSLIVGAMLLAGCLLISGEQTTISVQGSAANILTTFVSAEGSDEYRVPALPANTEVQAIVIVAVETGDVQIDLLQPDGSVSFVLAGRPGAQVTRSGPLRSDDQGQIRYRITARGARNGEIQIFLLPGSTE